MLILASNSPRRRELLKGLNIEFTVVEPTAEEIMENLPAEKIAVANAMNKANSVARAKKDVVIGADTIVVLDGVIYGKPKDEEDAVKMLTALSGKTHSVITGIAVIKGKQVLLDGVTSKVTFNQLDEKTIQDYVATKEPLDKAGAYGVQNDNNIVKSVEGSYSNVVGLPMERLKELLTEVGVI